MRTNQNYITQRIQEGLRVRRRRNITGALTAHKSAYSPVEYSRSFLHGTWHLKEVAARNRGISVRLNNTQQNVWNTGMCAGIISRDTIYRSTQSHEPVILIVHEPLNGIDNFTSESCFCLFRWTIVDGYKGETENTENKFFLPSVIPVLQRE